MRRYTSRHRGLTRGVIAAAVFQLFTSPGVAQRLPGSTTRTSAAAAVRPAFRTVLSQPGVRTAVKAEVLRQLRLNRPVALTGMGWAMPIDMGPVYNLGSVRSALVSTLGQNGVSIVDGAIRDPGRIVISFTPQQIGKLVMGDIVKDIAGSFARGALANKMTGVVGADDVMIVMLVVGSTFLAGAALREWWDGSSAGSSAPASGWDPASYDPNADPDQDGKANMVDDDDDGDGVPDEQDYYPDDKSRSICDCSGRGGIFYGGHATNELVNTVFAAADLARTQLRSAISLGAVQTGQAASIRLAIP